MVTRREAGDAGALRDVVGIDGAYRERRATRRRAAAQSAEAISAEALRGILRELQEMREAFDGALRRNSLTVGALVPIRRAFEQFLRANTKYPDYCEIGIGIFTELYDWHVKYQQTIEVQRVEGRMAIRFMFTWMLLRTEQDLNFVGIPYDRA
jgi:hypothetical protein